MRHLFRVVHVIAGASHLTYLFEKITLELVRMVRMQPTGSDSRGQFNKGCVSLLNVKAACWWTLFMCC